MRGRWRKLLFQSILKGRMNHSAQGGARRDTMRHAFYLFVVISIVSTGTLTIPVLSLSAAEVQQIKPEELKKLIESNDPTILVVDNQPKGVYDLGHIKGAVNFPWAIDIKSPGNLPRDKTLVLYCDCAHAEDSLDATAQLTNKVESCAPGDDSTDVAQQLMEKFGYKNSRVLEGGWSKWQQLGYPIDKNAPH
jgi:rhodanese-related sulfurtransferase